MFGVIIFLTLTFFAILDVSFFARLTILGTSPVLSLVAILMIASLAGNKRNFLWVIVPVSIISIFSEHPWWIIFIAFVISYFLMAQKKTYFWENQTSCRLFNTVLSTMFFYLIIYAGSMLLKGETFFAGALYSLMTFVIIETSLFFIGRWVYNNGKVKRIW